MGERRQRAVSGGLSRAGWIGIAFERVSLRYGVAPRVFAGTPKAPREAIERCYGVVNLVAGARFGHCFAKLAEVRIRR